MPRPHQSATRYHRHEAAELRQNQALPPHVRASHLNRICPSNQPPQTKGEKCHAEFEQNQARHLRFKLKRSDTRPSRRILQKRKRPKSSRLGPFEWQRSGKHNKKLVAGGELNIPRCPALLFIFRLRGIASYFTNHCVVLHQQICIAPGIEMWATARSMNSLLVWKVKSDVVLQSTAVSPFTKSLSRTTAPFPTQGSMA